MQLHVRLVEAKDIAKMDTFSKTDAYCLLSLNGTSPKKSKVIDNSMTPKWNEEFHFNVLSAKITLFLVILKLSAIEGKVAEIKNL